MLNELDYKLLGVQILSKTAVNLINLDRHIYAKKFQ